MARLVVALWLLARTAHAEPGIAETPFVTLDRVDGQSRARAELEMSTGAEEGQQVHPFVTSRLELHVQKVAESGFGGYLDAGAVLRLYDGEPRAALPAFELGGLYAARLSDHVDMIGHLGVASMVGDQLTFVTLHSAVPRATDFSRSVDETWLRVATSHVLRLDPIVVRTDVGLDVPSGDNQALLHAGVGVGARRDRHAIALESVLLMKLSGLTDRDEFRELRIMTLALSYRLSLRSLDVFASFVQALSNRGMGLGDIDGRCAIVGVELR